MSIGSVLEQLLSNHIVADNRLKELDEAPYQPRSGCILPEGPIRKCTKALTLFSFVRAQIRTRPTGLCLAVVVIPIVDRLS